MMTTAAFALATLQPTLLPAGSFPQQDLDSEPLDHLWPRWIDLREKVLSTCKSIDDRMARKIAIAKEECALADLVVTEYWDVEEEIAALPKSGNTAACACMKILVGKEEWSERAPQLAFDVLRELRPQLSGLMASHTDQLFAAFDEKKRSESPKWYDLDDDEQERAIDEATLRI